MTQSLGNRCIRAIAALLLALVFAVPALPLHASPATSPPAAQPGGKLVLAFYYMWYGVPNFSSGQMPDRPPTPYYSNQPGVIERPVRAANDAGLDAYISSSTGPGPAR